MGQETVGDIATVVDAINRRDLDQISEVLDPQFEFHAAIGAVEQRVYVGLDGLRTFVGDMDATWDGYRLELTDVRVAGAQAVVLMHIFGTARASAIPLDQDFAQVATWRQGKLWRVVTYRVPAEALEAVGLAH